MARQPSAASLRLVFDTGDEEDPTLQVVDATLSDVRRLYALGLDLAHPDYEPQEQSAPRSPKFKQRHLRVMRQHDLVVERISLESPLELVLAIPLAAAATGVLWVTAQLVEKVYLFPVKVRREKAETRLAELDLEDRLARREREKALMDLRQHASRNLALRQASLDVETDLEEELPRDEDAPEVPSDSR